MLLVILSHHQGGRDLLPYLGIACGYFGRLNTNASIATSLFDEVSEMYILAHRNSSGDHSRTTSLGPGASQSIIERLQSSEQHENLFAEFEPQESVISVPLVEDPQSFHSNPDDPPAITHLDDLLFDM